MNYEWLVIMKVRYVPSFKKR